MFAILEATLTVASFHPTPVLLKDLSLVVVVVVLENRVTDRNFHKFEMLLIC